MKILQLLRKTYIFVDHWLNYALITHQNALNGFECILVSCRRHMKMILPWIYFLKVSLNSKYLKIAV